jgi:hypothetical protein
VPVPQGERSNTPVQDWGRDRSSVPVDTTTAFRAWASGRAGGPEICAMVTPAIAGFSGCTTVNCSRAAALTISATRTMSAMT